VKISAAARLSALLARLARDPQGQQPHPDVEESRDVAAGGGPCCYDLYLPRRPAVGLVVAVHGATLHGGRDPRLIHFGRCLARGRVACALPSLPGLTACRWETEDVDALLATARHAADALRVPLGMVGFSFGGSYALLAASRPPLADRVRFVVAFSAYHDMEVLFDGYAAARHAPSRSATEWDDWIYLNVVLAGQYPDEAGLPQAVRVEARDLLWRFCHGATAEEKRAFYDRHLESFDLVGVASRLRDRGVLDALSPAGKLGGLRAAVSLIHDDQDTTVPPEQGEQLWREVAAVVGADRCRFLLTSLLSHVTIGNVIRLREVSRLYGALAPLAEW
jgi:hypothetical protein